MIKIGKSQLLTQNVDRLAPGSAGARSQSSVDRVTGALSAQQSTDIGLDREDDPGEYDATYNPELLMALTGFEPDRSSSIARRCHRP